ncbi:MAG TPA: NAD(P)-dependent oxidoreductase [Planctomycetaceae bacterium]|nr:NAD(P)-dependent oxidoreductase [Planctomycetaceae bacterium]
MHKAITRRERDQPAVLITGASGLIGSRLAGVLAPRQRVVGLDVNEPPRDAGLDFLKTDLTDDGSVRQSLAAVKERYGPRIASVVHLAAYYDFSGEPSPLYDELTVQGTRRLLRGLQEFQCEQFVFASSLLVMQPTRPGQPLTERSPTEAKWEYPRSKLAAEEVIRRERGNIPIVILRIAGVYDEDCHSLPLSQHIARIREKKLESYLFPGDSEHGQALVHLDDLIDCFQRVIELRDRLPPEEMFLIAEPDVVSYGELQDMIGERLHGSEWPTIRVPKAVAKAGAWVQDKLAGDEDKPFIKPWMVDFADAHYEVDPGRARRILGWEPKHRLRLTISEMIRRLKADPAGWHERNYG